MLVTNFRYCKNISESIKYKLCQIVGDLRNNLVIDFNLILHFERKTI